MSKIRVLLADDHSIVRNGIKLVLNQDPEIEIVGEASDGLETLQLVEKDVPDVLISDISMPKLSGIEVASMIQSRFPITKVLILSMHEDEDYILRAFEVGAMGYLPKDIDHDELVLAIKTIHKGNTYVNKEISSVLALAMLKKKSPQFNDDKALTERELEVLSHIVQGSSNKQIAQMLFISTRTVDTHRRNLMEKLRVNNAAELVRIAMEKGLIQQ